MQAYHIPRYYFHKILIPTVLGTWDLLVQEIPVTSQ